MIINIQDDILKIQVLGLLDRMLADKTTKKNIMWATDAYDALGMKYERNEEITSDLITGHHASVIKTRARKAMEQQTERTRQHAMWLWVHIDYFQKMYFLKMGSLQRKLNFREKMIGRNM